MNPTYKNYYISIVRGAVVKAIGDNGCTIEHLCDTLYELFVTEEARAIMNGQIEDSYSIYFPWITLEEMTERVKEKCHVNHSNRASLFVDALRCSNAVKYDIQNDIVTMDTNFNHSFSSRAEVEDKYSFIIGHNIFNVAPGC